MSSVATFQRRLFDYDEFERMGPLLIVPECAELLGGVVTDKTGGGTPHCWTYDQYMELGRAGILNEDERTELLDGEIVCMSPIGHRHVYVVDQLTKRLGQWMAGRALLRVQSPLRFNPVEAPQPDVVLLRPNEDEFRSREAGPWDALLVVEVAETSLDTDREVKGPKYARAAIAEYWVADVDSPAVIVHQKPVGGEYTEVRTYGPGESWQSPSLEGRTVSVDEVLGLPLPPR